MPRPAAAMHGVLLLDKPPGLTSARLLDPLKRLAGRGTGVGHAGTLDPFATGLVLALLGEATRLASLAVGLPKTYEALVRFGTETDTLDPEGRVVDSREPGPAPPPGLAAALRGLTGEIEQVPPAHSAVKVAGERAYRRARRGEAPALRPRTVTVYALEPGGSRWPDLALTVRCGAGTYVRALARDLGRALGLPAHLAALRRTEIGPFAVDDAAGVPADAAGLAARLRLPMELVRAAGLPVVTLAGEAARRFAAGNPAPSAGAPPGRIAAVSGDLLLGLGEALPTGHVQPRVVLGRARKEILG